MATSVLTIIANAPDFESLETLEINLGRQPEKRTPEVEEALKGRYATLGRALVSRKTGLSLNDLSPAEEKIVKAVAKYVGLQRRQGKQANRTYRMLSNRGLLGSAEASVCRSTPTQGFEVLEEADAAQLSFEQIIVDHPSEFSLRAIWYARRTLGLPNESARPPASPR